MSLKSKKICIGVVLVVAFFIVAVLMMSSVNLFSLSNNKVKVEYSELLEKIGASSVAKVLSSKDKLKLINYFYEYQKLKSNIKNLSYDELNRFLVLGKYLAKYIDPKYLGMSGEVVSSVINRYGDIASEEVISGVAGKLENKEYLLKQVEEIKKQTEDLYDANKISKAACEEILAKLGDIEYHINLSSFGSKNIQLDLNNIAKIISKEKASYSINADISELMKIEKSLELVQKEMDGMKYISDFVNSGMSSIEKVDIPNIEDMVKLKERQFSTIVNNVDAELLGDILDIVKKNEVGNVEAVDIEFAKAMKLPNITIEGSIEDAWDMNFDLSSLNVKNLLAPMDVSLISEKSLDDMARSITKIKVPGVYQGDTNVPDVTTTPSPGNTHVPTTTEPTSTASASPSAIPGTTNPSIVPTVPGTTNPSVVPTTVPDVTASPTILPSDSVVSEDTPTQNTPHPGDEDSAFVPWHMNINYKAIIAVLVISALTGASVVLLRFRKKDNTPQKKIVYESSDTSEDMQSNIEKIPISYKERLLTLGLDVLFNMRMACIKDKRERTPREIVNIFLDKYTKCDRNVAKKFLKYYESALFYKLDVSEELYESFSGVCNEIYGILRKEEEGIT